MLIMIGAVIKATNLVFLFLSCKPNCWKLTPLGKNNPSMIRPLFASFLAPNQFIIDYEFLADDCFSRANGTSQV